MEASLPVKLTVACFKDAGSMTAGAVSESGELAEEKARRGDFPQSGLV